MHGTVTFRTNINFSATPGIQIPKPKVKEVESVPRVCRRKIDYVLLAQHGHD